MPEIHPTALIDRTAQIADSAEIGPYCVIGPNVTIGERVKLKNFVTIAGHTELGDDCICFQNVTLGEDPQILGAKPGNFSLKVGAKTVFRENVTIHASAETEKLKPTLIGEECYFMVGSHIGHHCQIGNKCVLANLASIGGECIIGDQVWLGGGVFIHQQSWVGDHAFIGGGSILVGDVVPFASTQGNHARIATVNVVGLKRRGFSKADIKAIYGVFKALGSNNDNSETRLFKASSIGGGNAHAQSVIDFVNHPRSGRKLCKFRDRA